MNLRLKLKSGLLCALCKGRFMRPPLIHFLRSLRVFTLRSVPLARALRLLDFAKDLSGITFRIAFYNLYLLL
jgi:hypothetical protein